MSYPFEPSLWDNRIYEGPAEEGDEGFDFTHCIRCGRLNGCGDNVCMRCKLIGRVEEKLNGQRD